MNKLIIIGNLTADPQLRYTPQSVPVCDFTIAVNGKRKDDPTQFFRVTAWRQLGETCAKYLAKGRKVFVSGTVSYRTWETADGQTRVSIEVTADDVEFLSSAQDDRTTAPAQHIAARPQEPMQTRLGEQYDAQTGFTQVETDELPF